MTHKAQVRESGKQFLDFSGLLAGAAVRWGGVGWDADAEVGPAPGEVV